MHITELLNKLLLIGYVFQKTNFDYPIGSLWNNDANYTRCQKKSKCSVYWIREKERIGPNGQCSVTAIMCAGCRIVL